MVHSSLRSLGWVEGGAETLIRVLLEQLGEAGNLVIPAATPRCADPELWINPPAPPEMLDELREQMDLFDSAITPTTLGAIPEFFRQWPGTLRSDHPLESICAHGGKAEWITNEHPLSFSEGPDGPFGKLHQLDCQILLIGVGFNRCTALHYAETLSAKRRETRIRFPMMQAEARVWLDVANVADDNDSHFPLVGEQFLATGKVVTGSLGEAEVLRFSMSDLVEFAVGYFDSNL